MSHFCGLVIMTPEYAENNGFEDSLEMYSENMEYEPYVSGEVSDYEKVNFLEYYNKDKIDEYALKNEFADTYTDVEELQSFEDLKNKCDYEENRKHYIRTFVYEHKDEYSKFFIKKFPELFADFDKQYEEHGEGWNDYQWKKNDDGVWEEWSTYNPNSVYDWYTQGGRWSQSIKTKSGKFVDECFLDEIDWSPFKPEDYEEEAKKDWSGKEYRPLKENVKWHFTKDNPPYCLFVDGEHISKGKMGWWAISTDEKEDWNEQVQNILKKIDGKSIVCLMDFHI